MMANRNLGGSTLSEKWHEEATARPARDGAAAVFSILLATALFIATGYFACCMAHPEEADAAEAHSVEDVFKIVNDALGVRNVDVDEAMRWECLADIQRIKAERAAAELLAFEQNNDEMMEEQQAYLQEYYEPEWEEPAPSYSGSGYSNDFMRDGVVYGDDGTRYTWYSSNVLYHYRTGEWTADDEGFYRDSDGYYVVASDDHAEGEVVDTPWGEGKVYDSGCDSGTVDMYTAF